LHHNEFHEPGEDDEPDSIAIPHLSRAHGFGFEDVSVPPEPGLHEIHADLHDQETAHGLPTHEHAWVVVEIATGAIVLDELPTEELAMSDSLGRFGADAGKEYVVRRSWRETQV
jgi:hypothetical protein